MTNLDLLSASLTTWYQQPLGQTLAAMETEQLKKNLAPLTGQYILQLGYIDLLNDIAIKSSPRRIIVCDEAETQTQTPFVQASYAQLPFANASLDIVIMSHILEFEPSAKAALDEAWRALKADGHLVILGFNPWSLWGVTKLFYSHHAPPWSGHFYSASKLLRRLHQLHAEIITFKSFFFRPPLNQASFLGKSHWLETIAQFLLPPVGGVYLLVAKKNIMPLTPIRSHWQWQSVLADNKGIVQPTTQGVKRE